MQKEFKIEMLPVDQLVPADYNPRKISEKKKQRLKKSLDKFGFAENVVINRLKNGTFRIVGGHQRIKIAKILGLDKIPCKVYDNLSKRDEQELNLDLNHTTGETDRDMLIANFEAEVLEEVIGAEELYGQDKIYTDIDQYDFDIKDLKEPFFILVAESDLEKIAGLENYLKANDYKYEKSN